MFSTIIRTAIRFSLVARNNILYDRISTRCKMYAKNNNFTVDEDNILVFYRGALKQHELLKYGAECIIDTSDRNIEDVVDVIINKLNLKKTNDFKKKGEIIW